MYCEYFIWCVSCTMIVLTSCVMCVNVCGCFDNCVDVLVVRVLVLTVFCIFYTVLLYYFVYVYCILICFVSTSVRTSATG
jgi:hypothetical protein